MKSFLVQKSFWRSNWMVVIAIALVTLVVLSPVLIFQTTTFFTNLDNVDQFYSWYQKLAVSINDGYLPIWNAGVFAGQSFAGELQPGVFYPLNVIWVAIFGSAQGISQLSLDYLVAVHFWVAAFGFYLLLKQLGAQQWAALAAGITFAFSGTLAFRSISQTAIFFGLALIPYSIYFLAKFRSKTIKRSIWLVACGISLGLIILSGHIAPFFFAVLSLAIFEIIQLLKTSPNRRDFLASCFKSFKSFALVMVCALVVALPQLWVTSSYLPSAYRIQAGGYTAPDQKIDYGSFAKAFRLDIHEAANLVDPMSYPIRDGNSIFIGLVPLIVIVTVLVLAIKRFREGDLWLRHSLFSKAMIIFSVIAMLGYATWFAVVLYELPFVYQVRQLGRYSILFHIGLLIALAASLPVWAGIKITKNQKRWLLVIGAFLVINSVYLLLLRHHIFSLHHAVQVGLAGLAIGSLVVWAKESARKVVITLLIIVTAAVNGLWFLPNVKDDTKLPSSYALPTGLVNLLEGTDGEYRVEIRDDSLPVNTGNVYKVQTIGGYAATVYAPYYEFSHDPNIDPELRNDLLGVRLVAQKQLPGQNDKVVYADQNTALYLVERPTALPKFFISTSAGSSSRDSYYPLKTKTLDYNDRYQKYSVALEDDAEVVVSEVAYKGWQAKVDGQSVPIGIYSLAGHPVFKTIKMTKGTHRVELVYKPFGIF